MGQTMARLRAAAGRAAVGRAAAAYQRPAEVLLVAKVQVVVRRAALQVLVVPSGAVARSMATRAAEMPARVARLKAQAAVAREHVKRAPPWGKRCSSSVSPS